ncbi:hypothetical protein LTR64_005065 [Lithohypha guttulata]|uniref:uncharacterized protein n=1 Tax=Lithohypha guttulata TaxID=1690604 RepID=UPI002DE019F5|nr:hypothetical protein LTR51_005100 [Lithohypha guttulata]
MVELTIGVASACIAACIALLQFVIPNALALVLTGTLSESHSAVTWSVVSRFLLSSDWPLFLRSDSASSNAVAGNIAVVTWIRPLTLLIAAIAAIVSPLGLYDGIYPATNIQEVAFVYAADRGPLGSGTPARNVDFGFSRVCAEFACPGEPELGNITQTTIYNGTNRTRFGRIASPEIPQSLVDLFQSGVNDKTSMSSFFDVQYRQLEETKNFWIVDNSSFLTGDFKMLGSSILNNEYELLEGVILDTINEWEEDILFLEPEAACVNTNLTVYYTLTDTGLIGNEKGLVDRGGFVDINRTDPYPVASSKTGEYPFTDSQRLPMLYDRAYFAAWLTNVFTMQFLNVTEPRTNRSRISSALSQRFRVNSTFQEYDPNESQYIERTTDFSQLVKTPYNYTFSDPAKYGTNYSSNPEIANPFNVASEVFHLFTKYCKSSYGSVPVNITEIAVELGMVGGVGHRVDKGFEDAKDVKAPNSTWERPIYVCSGATKAKIKTVTFRYNATIDNSLAGLYIKSIKDKTYTNSVSAPIWGFETPQPQFNISDINPLWGIIDPARVKTPNLTTLQAPSFYIPHSSTSAVGTTPDLSYQNGDNVPMIRTPPDLWSATLYSSVTGPAYSGKGDQDLQMLWRELSRNSTGIEKMLRLIWVDLAANYLVGTKGHHTTKHQQPVSYSANSKRQASGGQSGQATFPVHVLEHHIRYHWIYAIPALTCVSIVSGILLFALVSMMCGRGTITRLKYYLYAITSGRVMAAFVYPNEGGMDHRQAETNIWIQEVAHKPVQIFEHQPTLLSATGVDHKVQMHQRKGTEYVSVKQKADNDDEL